MVTLGRQVRCRITQFTGTATARTVYLYGHPSIRVTRTDSTGKPEHEWLPEDQLDTIDAASSPPGFGS